MSNNENESVPPSQKKSKIPKDVPTLIKRWWATAGKDVSSVINSNAQAEWQDFLCGMLKSYAEMRALRPQSPAIIKKKSGGIPQSEKILIALCSIMAAGTSKPLSALRLIETIGRLDKAYSGSIIKGLRADSEHPNILNQICLTGLDSLETILVYCDVSLLRAFLSFCDYHLPELKQRAVEKLCSVQDESLAQLNSEMRGFIYSLRPREEKKLEIDVVDESQKGSIGQVALVLLRAWGAQTEGEKALEVYESLKHYARVYHRVALFGTVGEQVKYNSQSFYGENLNDGDNVIVIRPGAQVDTDEGLKVLIPAAVEIKA